MEQPSDLAALKRRIVGQAIVLPMQYSRMAHIAFERPELIAFGTVKSVAHGLGASPSTVLRLSQALGFTRFRSFRDLFRNHLRMIAARGQPSAKRPIAAEQIVSQRLHDIPRHNGRS